MSYQQCIVPIGCVIELGQISLFSSLDVGYTLTKPTEKNTLGYVHNANVRQFCQVISPSTKLLLE